MATGDRPSKDLIIGAMIVMLTNWDSSEVRTGRRGDYLTTGAMQIRFRTVPKETQMSVLMALRALGEDIDEEELAEVFNGNDEFQMSFAINKFQSKSRGLSTADQRAIERVKALLEDSQKQGTVRDKLAA